MDWDEGPEVGGPHGPYFQSQRGRALRRGRRRGWSPRATPIATTAPRPSAPPTRRAAEKSRRSPTASAASRSPTSDLARFEAEGRPFALRFQVPLGRTLVVHDLIKGDVEQKTDEIGDFVIVRPDGTPLYNFASVVDDVEMKITHVVRAEEHLPNTFSQLLVFEALGDALPAFAHVPYVAEPGSKKKLSKRKIEEPSGSRLLHQYREGLPARGDDELPRPARLELRRQPGDLHPRRADREVLARPRQQLARQPRPRQALLDRGRVDEDPPAGAQGRGRPALPGERRARLRAALATEPASGSRR